MSAAEDPAPTFGLVRPAMIQWTTNGTRMLSRGTAAPRKRPATWNWMAVVPGAMVWMLLAVSAMLPAPHDDPLSQVHLAALAARMNQGLPRRLESGTTLVAVRGLSGTLVYNLRLMNQDAGDAGVHERISTATKSLARWECGEERLRRYIDLGVTMRHVYEDRMGTWVATMDVSRDDCDW